jgi:hypothetical protein
MLGSSNAAPPIKKSPFNIDANQLATAQQAICIPYIAGRRRVSLHYIAPAYNERAEKVTATTGKDQTNTVGYKYFSDIAGIFGLGKFNRIFRLIFDSVIEWEGNIAADSDPYEPVTVSKRGVFYFYWGTPDQPVDAFVLTPIGPLPPGVDPRDTTTWPGGDYTNKHP